MRLNRRPALRRSTRICIANSGSQNATLTPTQAGTVSSDGTVMVGMVVPSGTRAIRLCFANTGPTPTYVGGVSYCPSTSWNDYVNPTGGGAWKRGTFNYGGVAGRLPVNLSVGQILSATLPGNGGVVTEPGLVTKWEPGTSTGPKYSFSDILPLDTLPRTDGGPGRLVFVRVVWPAGQPVSETLSSGNTLFTGFYSGHGLSSCFLTGNHLTDVVSGAAPFIGLPFAWLEAYSNSPGSTLVAGGDSQIQGFDNAFHLQAAYALTTAEHPIGVVNAAWGGSQPNNWLAHLLATCDAVDPSVVLMQGFSGNDNLEAVSAADFAEGARWQVQRILAVRDYLPADVPMVITTPIPRNYTDPTIIAEWDAMRAPILALEGPGMRVLDVTPICEDPAAPGQWKAGYGDSYGLHPNATCQGLLTALFQPMLADVLGLGA